MTDNEAEDLAIAHAARARIGKRPLSSFQRLDEFLAEPPLLDIDRLMRALLDAFPEDKWEEIYPFVSVDREFAAAIAREYAKPEDDALALEAEIRRYAAHSSDSFTELDAAFERGVPPTDDEASRILAALTAKGETA